jgi:hypothetical protein
MAKPSSITYQVVLKGLVVSVLTTGLKVHGLKPSRGNGFSMAIKIHSIPSEGK